DYVNGFVYENNALSFFASPEGRVVKNGSNLEYQYAIADNQGNTRVVFTSATPAPVAPIATFEGDANDGGNQYLNVNGTFVVSNGSANHTPGGSVAIRMNQTYKIGPAKSVKVYPGDKIDMEVWEYHENPSGFGTTSTPVNSLINSVAGAFGGVNGGAGESGLVYNGVNSAITSFGTGGNQGDNRPAAYLNYILVDKDYKVLDAGWQVAPGATFTKQKISFPTKEIKEAGFIYVWLSYDDDSPNWVYFDDFKVTHTKSNIIQYNEYYPFGLQTASSWTRENTKDNRYLYNAANELNQATGWYETFYRGYDPTVGRFLQIDPLAHVDHFYSPFVYGRNNPIQYNDPSGLMAMELAMIIRQLMSYEFGGTWTSESSFDGGGGSFSPFGSYEQGMEAGISYNDTHNSWDQTSSKSEGMTRNVFAATMNAASTGNRQLVRTFGSHTEGRYGQQYTFFQVDGDGNWFVPYTNDIYDPLAQSNDSGLESAAQAAIAFMAIDLSVPDPTDAVGPKWLGYAVVGTVAAAIIHANSKNNKNPHLVYEIYSIDAMGTRRTEKYGITSREDNKDGNNGRPAYQANKFNREDPSRAYSWQT
ncbi:MAG TPA: RHS repeat-associated core domain-containing protein, partial [Saprospiraceae bacterium]